MESQSSFPVVEDDRWVHFIYRGSATDVGIRGNMIAGGEEDEMFHIEGTDLFYRSYQIEPGARWEYRFTVDFDKSVRDPRNSRSNFDGGMSEVATTSWQQPAFVTNYTGDAPGSSDSFQLGSRQIQVHLPAGYEQDRQQRHPLVVVTDGGDWRQTGKMLGILNHLSNSQIESPIVAFVSGRGERGLGGGGTGRYAGMLATELVPELDRRYRTRTEPRARTIFGKRGAAVAAAYTALAYPDVFGKCIAISYGRADTVRADMVTEGIESAKEGKPEFYVTWNRYEVWRPQSFSCREQSQALVKQLKENGFNVTGIEKTDSAGWRSWRIQAGEALIALMDSAN